MLIPFNNGQATQHGSFRSGNLHHLINDRPKLPQSFLNITRTERKHQTSWSSIMWLTYWQKKKSNKRSFGYFGRDPGDGNLTAKIGKINRRQWQKRNRHGKSIYDCKNGDEKYVVCSRGGPSWILRGALNARRQARSAARLPAFPGHCLSCRKAYKRALPVTPDFT